MVVFQKPEECIGGQQHDYWSLGCSLVYLLMGTAPFICIDVSVAQEASDPLAKPKRILQQHIAWVRL